MKFNITLLISLLILIAVSNPNINAQTDSTFVPHGKPLVLVFTNVNATLNKSGNSKAFELTRAYLGYEYYFSKTISARINTDIADPGTGKLQMTAIIKNAFVQYRKNGFSARVGMFGVDAYNLQEKQWGYRYIYKSFQDAYNFGPSADLGAAIEYTPSRFITLDASVLNGEGYKKLQADSTFKTTIGLTIRPFEGFALRAYYDRMKDKYAQSTTALYAGYSVKKFRFGLEYNIQKNNGMLHERDFSGISVYSSMGIGSKFTAFARYDYLMSETPSNVTDPWNLNNDGQLILTGFDYSPVNGVKIAPTFRGWAPRNNSAHFTSQIALNFEIKF